MERRSEPGAVSCGRSTRIRSSGAPRSGGAQSVVQIREPERSLELEPPFGKRAPQKLLGLTGAISHGVHVDAEALRGAAPAHPLFEQDHERGAKSSVGVGIRAQRTQFGLDESRCCARIAREQGAQGDRAVADH